MNKKIISIILSITMLLGFMTAMHSTAAAPIKGSVLYQEDFEGLSRNWKPTNGNAAYYSLHNEDGVEPGTTYARIDAISGPIIYKHGLRAPTGKRIIIEFDYRGDTIAGGTGKYFYLGENPSYGRIYFGKMGKLVVTGRRENDDYYEDSIDLTSNVWHHIIWEVNFEGNKQYVTIDDNEPFEVDAYNVAYNDPSGLSRLLVRADSYSGYMELDNLVVYDPDGPDTASSTPKPEVTPLPTKDPDATATPAPVMLKTLYSEDFEEGNAWLPLEIIGGAKFEIKSTDGASETSGNYAHIESGASYTPYTFARKLRESAYGDNVICEFDYRGNVGKGDKYIYMDDRAFYGKLFFTQDGALNFWETKIADLKPDTWHHIKWEINFKDKTTVMTVDQNTPVVLPADYSLTPFINQFLVSLEEESGYIDLDNINIYNPAGADPSPTPKPTPAPTKEPPMFKDTNGVSFEKAINAIAKLGIINGYEDGTFGPAKNITRAEFATVITRALQLEQDVSANNFTDVAPDHWAAGYIGAAVKAGIVNGMGDGTFAPDAYVTEEQVIKMIIAALGYNDEATEAGGYPSGYIKIASEKKMLTGIVISAKKEALRGRVAMLLSNALEIDIKGRNTTIKQLNTK